MGVVFSELSQRRNVLLHTASVWQEVFEYLLKFVGGDASPPKYGITTKGEGVTVPPEIVEEVTVEVQGKISALAVACAEIEQTIMEDRSGKEEQDRRKEEEARGEGAEGDKKRAPRAQKSRSKKGGKGKASRTKGRLRVVRAESDE